MYARAILRSFSRWFLVVLSIPKNEWLIDKSMSSEKRSMMLNPLESEVPPLNVNESLHAHWNSALSVTVTHQSFSIAA